MLISTYDRLTQNIEHPPQTALSSHLKVIY
jgi:hypothetical protein